MKKPKYTSPECVHDDGTLIKFISKSYMIRYLRYLSQKKKANAQL
jgi:hypothetical protein